MDTSNPLGPQPTLGGLGAGRAGGGLLAAAPPGADALGGRGGRAGLGVVGGRGSGALIVIV